MEVRYIDRWFVPPAQQQPPTTQYPALKLVKATAADGPLHCENGAGHDVPMGVWQNGTDLEPSYMSVENPYVLGEFLRGEGKGSKIRGKMGIKWDTRDGPNGHQPTASRCDLCLL